MGKEIIYVFMILKKLKLYKMIVSLYSLCYFDCMD